VNRALHERVRSQLLSRGFFIENGANNCFGAAILKPAGDHATISIAARWSGEWLYRYLGIRRSTKNIPYRGLNGFRFRQWVPIFVGSDFRGLRFSGAPISVDRART
jgi:hypothetical protein